jgi:hypothetical protein
VAACPISIPLSAYNTRFDRRQVATPEGLLPDEEIPGLAPIEQVNAENAADL